MILIKKKIFKVILSFLLLLVLFISSSVSAFAYFPIVHVEAEDYSISSDFTRADKVVYPSVPPHFSNMDSSVFSHSDLNGETYFFSQSFDNDFNVVTDIEISFPSLSPPESAWFGMRPSSITSNVVFRVNDSVFGAVVYGSGYFYISSSGRLCFVGDMGSEVDFYKLLYPYTSWSYFDCFEFSAGGGLADFANFVDGQVELIWSDTDILNSDKSEVYYPSDSSSLSGLTYSSEFSQIMYVTYGASSFVLSPEQYKFLGAGACALRFDDIGAVVASNTEYLQLNYILKAYDSSRNLISEVSLGSFDIFNASAFDIGTKLIDDYVYFVDFPDIDFDNSSLKDDFSVELEFYFVASGYALFFPGTFEIIEFESYDSDMKHEEVLGAIQNASDVVSGSVSSAKTELASEIVQASKDIQTSINDSSADIVTSITDSSEDIVSSVEQAEQGITEKLEETKNSLLDGIKDFFIPSDEVMNDIDEQWDSLLKKRFGALYEVSDIITDFAGNLQYLGTKNTIDIPEVTVNFGDTPFTFGGYVVNIVPDGFDFLVTTLKSIISIVCTFLFVNALRNKYDKLMGGANA